MTLFLQTRRACSHLEHKIPFRKGLTSAVYLLVISLSSLLVWSCTCSSRFLFCGSGGRGSCSQNGVVYTIKCDCGDQYIGHTARNVYARGREHRQAYLNKCDNSVMWRHCVDCHGAERRGWTMDVAARYGDDAMKRQIAEAVMIKRAERATMNSKREWRQIEIPRAVIEH